MNKQKEILTIPDIMRAVSRYSGVAYSEIKSGPSNRRTMPAKAIVIYFMRNHLKYKSTRARFNKYPYKKIGSYLGRHHTCIMYAERLMKDMLKVKDPVFSPLFDQVKEHLETKYDIYIHNLPNKKTLLVN